MPKMPDMDEHQKKLIAEKKAEYLEKHAHEEKNDEGFPPVPSFVPSATPKPASSWMVAYLLELRQK